MAKTTVAKSVKTKTSTLTKPEKPKRTPRASKGSPGPDASVPETSFSRSKSVEAPSVETTVETEAETLRHLIAPEEAVSSMEAERASDEFSMAGPRTLDTREILVRALDTRQSNVRKSMDPVDLEALQASLRRYGMLEPVIVQPIVGKHHGFQYRLIAGFRRTAAAKALGWESVPARIMEHTLSAEEIVAVQLTENLQRETMQMRDIIRAIQSLRQEGQGFRQVAEALGLGETTVRLYAHVGEVLERNPRLWPYFDRGLISLQHFRAANRIMQKTRERAEQAPFDGAARERIMAQAETVFVAMLERLAKVQPLTMKRVTAEVNQLLKRAGLEEDKPPSVSNSPSQIIPAVITGYEHLDVTQLNAVSLERLITASERQLEAARAQLARLAEA